MIRSRDFRAGENQLVWSDDLDHSLVWFSYYTELRTLTDHCNNDYHREYSEGLHSEEKWKG